MEWPKFDFVKCSYSQRRQLPDNGKSNCGLKKGRRKAYRSFVTDFENINSVKEEGSAGKKTVQNRSTVTLHQHTGSKKDSFQVDEKLNTKRIPPLSPVLVNGFLRNPLAYSLENSNSNMAEILTSAKCTSLLNPVPVNILQCRSSTTPEFSKSIFTPSHSKKLLLSDINPIFSSRRSEVISEGHDFGNFLGTSDSSIIALKKFEDLTECADICDLKCRGNNKANHDTKLLPPSRTVTSRNIHSSTSSLIFPETPSSSERDRKHLNRNENSPNLTSSPLAYLSDTPSTVQDVRSCSDALQNHSLCVDDSGSVFTAGEQSLDCFSDVTIHEVEASDLDFESMKSTSSPSGNRLKIYDIQDENDEMIYQRPHHRLSKLAETLKRRMLIGSSDLAMWKCEKPKQRPVRQVTVTSSAEQWGLCWTLIKNVNGSETVHVIDSEPIKRAVVQFSRKRSLERNANDGQQGCTPLDSSQQTSNEGIFNLYQPLSKLTTFSGEFILAPRYYR
uniref:Uncharacterized protein n=1 Tax=Setaria digitata TaxID=48799 RepID=A0A915Q6Y7_9BILA